MAVPIVGQSALQREPLAGEAGVEARRAETAVQMHYSAQGQRTNDIMRTLTVLTAIFLPLNLITGIFGMNFEWIPLLHQQGGFFIAIGLMLAVGLGLGIFFWRKRYLGTQARR
jgi:Mg2+ and Co2+ transporter CorA